MPQPRRPNPGSQAAQEQGCVCPVYDNAYGRGTWGTQDLPDGQKLFVINTTCKMHGEGVECEKTG